MAFNDFLVHGWFCPNCEVTLVCVPQALFRIPETEPDTSILCTDCGALGRYEEVIKQGAGLSSVVLTQERCADIVKQLTIAPHSP